MATVGLEVVISAIQSFLNPKQAAPNVPRCMGCFIFCCRYVLRVFVYEKNCSTNKKVNH
ncbi:hypothetical protein ACT7DZ_05375 [Bacillus cereus]